MANQPKVFEKMIGNIWFHTMLFEKAGDFKNGHKHNFDHSHIVGCGSVDVYEMEYFEDGTAKPDRTLLGTFKKGDIFLVPKNRSHTIVALEDGTFGSCIQAIRDDETEEILSCFCDGTEWDDSSTIKL